MSALNRISLSVALVASLLVPLGAKATTFKTIYSFDSESGCGPDAPMVIDQAGNLYGTTSHCGAYKFGTVFRFNPVSGKLTVLHAFSLPNARDGEQPTSNIAVGPDGMLYGTTTSGSAGKYGMVFKLAPAGGPLIPLHAFSGGAGGRSPDRNSPIVVDQAGVLYGTTEGGGANGLGMIYAIDTQTKAFKTVYSFIKGDTGNLPAGLLKAPSGLIYGAADYGGPATPPTSCGGNGCGAIFAFNPGTNQYKAIGNLTFIQGNENILTVGNGDRTIYGVGRYGGTATKGTLFSLSLATGVVTLLHTFSDATGAYPTAALVMTANGTLYGTTLVGPKSSSYGEVFSFNPVNKKFGTVHIFSEGAHGIGPDGSQPSGLTAAAHGALYGVTASGGLSGGGTIFKIVP
jgi:uncharacterized repeat protein (TIGR03803 family)